VVKPYVPAPTVPVSAALKIDSTFNLVASTVDTIYHFTNVWSNMSVDTHDFIVTFNRLYNFGQTPHVGDEKYAICLLSEIHDIHFKEEDDNEQ
jgi:hypothetical protein